MFENLSKIYIYGAGNRGGELFENIQKFYVDEILVEGFIDESKVGTKCGLPIQGLNTIAKDNTIVISLWQFETALEIALNLKRAGFSKIYWFSVKNTRKRRINFFIEQCIDCSEWTEATLYHVETHIIDACNLNCVGCSHFSPIFKNEKPNVEEQLRDIEVFSQKISSIAQFYILGGEPFLNNDVVSYVEKVKTLYPKSSVCIVTNGLLIPRLSSRLLRYLGEENVCVSISEYEPTRQIMESIVSTLNEYNIMYYVRPLREIFNIPLSLKPQDTPYCISDRCTIVGKGKIARCPTLLYVEELNNKFNLNFPTEGTIDLNSELTGKDLKEKLQESVPLCLYCTQNEVKWSTCGKDVLLEHFVKISD